MESVEESQPYRLTDDDKRQILLQLYEYQGCKAQLQAYEEYVEREKEQDAREQALWKKELEIQKEKLALKEKELQLEKEKSQLYKDLYESLKKKPGGFKCFLKRFFSIGLARC